MKKDIKYGTVELDENIFKPENVWVCLTDKHAIREDVYKKLEAFVHENYPHNVAEGVMSGIITGAVRDWLKGAVRDWLKGE